MGATEMHCILLQAEKPGECFAQSYPGRDTATCFRKRSIDACRHYRKLPTHSELDLYRKIDLNFPSLKTIRRQFGNQSEIVAALAKHVADNESYQDIPAILPSSQTPANEKLTLQSNNPEGSVTLVSTKRDFSGDSGSKRSAVMRSKIGAIGARMT